MIKVDQKISNPETGDCLSACVASLMEVSLNAVPNFTEAGPGLYDSLYQSTLYGYGWILCGAMHHESRFQWSDMGIDGYFIGCVPSRNFEGSYHAIIIDVNGVVVHDPSPKKQYQGENVFETGASCYFDTFQKRTDDQWLAFEAMSKRSA